MEDVHKKKKKKFDIMRFTDINVNFAITYDAVADTGFPRGGGANPKGGGANLLFGQFFLKTA